jgi:hypothetical protein
MAQGRRHSGERTSEPYRDGSDQPKIGDITGETELTWPDRFVILANLRISNALSLSGTRCGGLTWCGHWGRSRHQVEHPHHHHRRRGAGNTGVPTLILAVGDYALEANHNGESYTSRLSVTSGEAKQIEVVMESKPREDWLKSLLPKPGES